MRVQVNQMIYDEADDLCKCVLSQSQGKLFAFIQCIDTGMDGTARYTARYWGEFSHDAPEATIKRIMEWGGKWPQLPD
ncbi:hypothetical protein [Vreelandella massiliensis]|uniref:hypothetical protein n=1 Tax=Vreelandella massiliensis TaxID=1816686 RepID=UPI00096A6E14|nr:hypothetical protein [Halomonas massiliensis]